LQIVHTHSGLLAEHDRLVKEVNRVVEVLAEAQKPVTKPEASGDDELDLYMANLAAQTQDKGKITTLKV